MFSGALLISVLVSQEMVPASLILVTLGFPQVNHAFGFPGQQKYMTKISVAYWCSPKYHVITVGLSDS